MLLSTRILRSLPLPLRSLTLPYGPPPISYSKKSCRKLSELSRASERTSTPLSSFLPLLLLFPLIPFPPIPFSSLPLFIFPPFLVIFMPSYLSFPPFPLPSFPLLFLCFLSPPSISFPFHYSTAFPSFYHLYFAVDISLFFLSLFLYFLPSFNHAMSVCLFHHPV